MYGPSKEPRIYSIHVLHNICLSVIKETLLYNVTYTPTDHCALQHQQYKTFSHHIITTYHAFAYHSISHFPCLT